jgi:predicted component of type VI protein secretion system
MDSRPNIFWYQGLFLQPHHLQMMEQAAKQAHRPFLETGGPHIWGTMRIEIDGSSIKNHLFQINAGEFLFPDGTLVSFPGNAVLRPRSFKKAMADNPQPFKAYLGLRKWNPSGENVTVTDATTDPATVRTRFVADVNPREVRDTHQGGAPAQIRVMEHLLGLFWEPELPGLGDYLLIPVAQLEQERGDPRLSDRYAPPSLTLGGSEGLLQMVRSIRDQLGAHLHLHLHLRMTAPRRLPPEACPSGPLPVRRAGRGSSTPSLFDGPPMTLRTAAHYAFVLNTLWLPLSLVQFGVYLFGLNAENFSSETVLSIVTWTVSLLSGVALSVFLYLAWKA